MAGITEWKVPNRGHKILENIGRIVRRRLYWDRLRADFNGLLSGSAQLMSLQHKHAMNTVTHVFDVLQDTTTARLERDVARNRIYPGVSPHVFVPLDGVKNDDDFKVLRMVENQVDSA